MLARNLCLFALIGAATAVCAAGKYGIGGTEPCQACPCVAGSASRTTGVKTERDCYCEACGTSHGALTFAVARVL